MFDEEQLEYVYKFMEHPSLHNILHLTRVEHQLRTFNINNLKVGRTFKFDDGLKAFSRSMDVTQDVEYSEIGIENSSRVIFRTNGDVKHFNRARYVLTNYSSSLKSFVDTGGEFILDNIILWNV